jgi:YidC/Oxa1 family membrane protein insertase
MGMDRNTVIGFALIGLLLMGMFYFNSQGNQAMLREKKRIEDSMAAIKPKVDTLALARDSMRLDSIRRVQAAGTFIARQQAPAQTLALENDLIAITLSTKGAQPVGARLKKFKTASGKPVELLQEGFSQLGYKINTGSNQTSSTSELVFVAEPVQKNPDGSSRVRMTLIDSTGKGVIHTFTLKPSSYLVDWTIDFQGAEQLLTGQTLNLEWRAQVKKAEKDLAFEKQQVEFGYLEADQFDFERLGGGDGEVKFNQALSWTTLKQQFFVQGLIAPNKFSQAKVSWLNPTDTASQVITQTTGNYQHAVPAGANAQVPLQLYYGPSDYNELQKLGNQMEQIVPYGSGIFAFVKYINRHFLLPVFDFLRGHVASMGIVILLLTLFIRLLTSPILYSSYLSGAKMKALKPEIDALKAKYKDDQQAFGMEQMKLWRSAGVNPLGGCLPALLQIPIFMSLYYFFQANIDLRGQSFLWASDLAAYDSIYDLPFYIPLYGDHISLFTLTATITSLAISLYSMANMQDNSNPVMKYMPYIFPILLLGVFNGLPAALTWYYTISNTITLILQFVIQTYIIDHEKILRQIEENKKKPVKQNKLQERLQAMQEANKQMQDARKGNKK